MVELYASAYCRLAVVEVGGERGNCRCFAQRDDAWGREHVDVAAANRDRGVGVRDLHRDRTGGFTELTHDRDCARRLMPAPNRHYVSVRSAIAALAVALVAAGCGAVNGVTPAATARHALACRSAPYVGRPTSGDLERPALTGPARTDVRNGVFTHTLTLDHGSLVVAPPRRDDRAGFAGDDAMCQVLASTFWNGAEVGRQSRDTIAAGLARVTVADAVLGRSALAGIHEFGSIDGVPDVNPRTPAPKAYHDRLAWVFVLQPRFAASCPSGGSAGSSAPIDRSLQNYQVFVVDAAVGADALLYTQRRNAICGADGTQGPYLDVPLTRVSVAWRLLSREPDGSSGQVSFAVGACDGYQGVATTAAVYGEPANLVRVVVVRPFGPLCQPVRTITEKLRAGRVIDRLPSALRHAAVGPYIE